MVACINRFYSHHQTELLANIANNHVVVQGNSIFSFSIAQAIFNFNLKISLYMYLLDNMDIMYIEELFCCY